MSTGITENILNSQDENETEPRHTVPTSEEVAKMIDGSLAMVGGRRDGTMFCDIAYLKDGYAYRPFGNQSAEWQWLRTEDFDRAFVAFGLVNMQRVDTVMQELAIESSRWRLRCRKLMSSMGRKSKRRLGKKMVNLIDS